MQLLTVNKFGDPVSAFRKHETPGHHDEQLRPKTLLHVVCRKRLDHWLNSLARAPKVLAVDKAHPKLFKSGSLDMYAATEMHRTFYQAWFAYFKEHDSPYIIAQYEEVLTDPAAFLDVVAARLNIERRIWKMETDIGNQNVFPRERKSFYLGVGAWSTP